MSAHRDGRSPAVTTSRQIDSQAALPLSPAFLFADVVAPAIVGALFFFIPLGLSFPARAFGAAALVLVGPTDRLVRRLVPVSASNFVIVIIRSTLALLFAALAPNLWAACLVVIVGQIMASIPAEVRSRILALSWTMTGAAAVIGFANDVPYFYATASMALIVVLSTDVWYREWHRNRSVLNERHNEMVDRARMFSWEIDTRTGAVASIAGNVAEVLGFSADEIVGKRADRIIGYDELSRLLANPTIGTEEDRVIQLTHRDKSTDVVLRVVRLASDDQYIVRGVSIDMTELSRASEALRFQAEHDELTGLANRKVVEGATAFALASGVQPVALIMADLDRFKEINDTLGHPTGDRVLNVMAQRFQRRLPLVDVIARMGGDEFAFVLTGAAADDAMVLAGLVHSVATEPIKVDGLTLAVACSVGVSRTAAPGGELDYPDLLRQADIAMYEAKRSGGGIRRFDTMPENFSLQRLQLVSEVAGALERNEFEMFFQPIVDLATGEVVAAEGLARWRHPRLGVLNPSEFLSEIEVAASYDEFTDEMISQAMALAAEAQPFRPLKVALNLGSRSFLDQGLPLRVQAALRRHGIGPEKITLELTESDLFEEQDSADQVIEALRSLGVRLSIDDFGTGYSNLTRLRALNVNEVKIDKGFVAGLGETSEDPIIVRSIIELASALGLEVVAEGVETIEQLQSLRRFGCSFAQGYYFATPMSRDDFLVSLGWRRVQESPTEADRAN